jgi:ABC-type branched-subunit amino acid transport system substrate-binding protein
MKSTKLLFSAIITICCLCLIFAPQALAVNDAFDPGKVSDMSDFDPNNPIVPSGDTIKIAIVASFSGPAALVGEIFWVPVQWAAHDINKRGGIMVDGKRKMIEVIRADHASQVPQAKKVSERMGQEG